MNTSHQHKEDNNELVISYDALRITLGILGISLPFILVLGTLFFGACKEIQPSISNYYHTNMRDVFVGYLCAISLFLFTYKGYDKRDNIATNIAGCFGFVVALFPTSQKIDKVTNALLHCNIHCREVDKAIGVIHLVAAGLFFITLSYICLKLFTKGKVDNKAKAKRNIVFKICGWIMSACVALLIAFFVFPEATREKLLMYKPVYVLETIALIAFGIAWLTKGKVWMRG